MAVIELKNVNVAYKDKKEVLKNINLTIERGEIVGLNGDSGCGKSTLAYVIGGFKKATGEKIKIPENGVGFVIQDPETALDPIKSIGFTLKETRLCFLKQNKLPIPKTREIDEYISKQLENFGILRERYKDFPRKFSGGELQRIYILRAILREPKVLILDKATSMLDVLVQAKIIKLLIKIQKEYKLTYLIISHDKKLLELVCNRVFIISDKQLYEVNKNVYS